MEQWQHPNILSLLWALHGYVKPQKRHRHHWQSIKFVDGELGRKIGQLTCYRIGQVNLFLTVCGWFSCES